MTFSVAVLLAITSIGQFITTLFALVTTRRLRRELDTIHEALRRPRRS